MAHKTNTDTGSPADSQPKDGTGIPNTISSDKMADDERITRNYTNNDDEVSDGARTLHPNRNENKDDATGIGGYRS